MNNFIKRAAQAIGILPLPTPDGVVEKILAYYRQDCYDDGQRDALRHDQVYSPGRLKYFASEYGSRFVQFSIKDIFGDIASPEAIGLSKNIRYKLNTAQEINLALAFADEYAKGYQQGVEER